MQFIHHRLNDPSLLSAISSTDGAEVDVRYHNNDLILEHNPFAHHTQDLITLESFLEHWPSEGPLILNIKSEGIEKRCIELIEKYKISDWFFLDLSMPYFVRYAREAKSMMIPGFSPKNLAVRFSELEPIEYALSFKGMARWVWIDCFSQWPINLAVITKFKKAGFKVCLVSPELQGHSLDMLKSWKEKLKCLPIDAVCSKHKKLWVDTVLSEV